MSYITYKLLDIADLTVDGSFALGGCVCAVMILNFHVDPWIALAVAAIAGMAAGAITGLLHTIFENSGDSGGNIDPDWIMVH